jgi:hypothetical protein
VRVADVDQRQPRQRSLWPLAAIGLVGCLVIGGGIFAASHIGHGDSTEQPKEARLLDSLTVNARLVTPRGTREAALTRTHVCPRSEGDTSATQVERELRLDADLTPRTARESLMRLYVRNGWVPLPQDPHGTVTQGSRWLSTSDNTAGHVLTVNVTDGSDAC